MSRPDQSRQLTQQCQAPGGSLTIWSEVSGTGAGAGAPRRDSAITVAATATAASTPATASQRRRRRGFSDGTIAVWDATPAKRMIVREYRGAMRRVRLAYDVAAHVLRRPRLPAPGGQLHYAYVTHQAVRDDDPCVLRALLRAAARDLRGGGQHFLSMCAPVDGIVDAATRGFFTTNLAARLFVVTAPGRTSDPMWFCGRPGFEMALV